MAVERLHKLIAAAGICSLREAERRISAGRVAVDGIKTREAGSKADPETQQVTVDGLPLPKIRRRTVAYAVNKPRGYVCSAAEQGSDPIVTSLVPASPRVYPAGRLDKESEGLVILTDDGALAQRLMHPSAGHTKEYRVDAVASGGPVDCESVVGKFLDGVELDGTLARAVRAECRKQGTGYSLRLVLSEGRNRQVRRMCGAVGLTVHVLRRTRVAAVMLGNLKSGKWRRLDTRYVEERTA